MVRDNVTGLIWEVKTDDDSVHDKDATYTWQDAQDVFIAQVNAETFGGRSDWRLPTIQELSSITALGRVNPAADITYFPNCRPSYSYYWSSSPNAYSSGYAWSVYFNGGSVGYHYNTNHYYVRCVRAGPTGSLDHLTLNGDGTVTDTSTGLMWQQTGPESSRTWEEALAYAEGLVFAGYDDWRLPNARELQSIVDYSEYLTAVNTSFFPNCRPSYYWSSSPSAYYLFSAWTVNFNAGYVSYYNKTDDHCYVRAVRGGQNCLLGHLIISAPSQGSMWELGDIMPISWDTSGIGGDVTISLSRQGGKTGTFDQIIAASTENDGSFDWTVTGLDSVNCMLKIVPVDDPEKGTTQGLFSLLEAFFTITATSGYGGNISPLGDVKVYKGADQTFTITPDEDYQILDVLVDGSSVGIKESYTFSDVQANHKIDAIFTKVVSTTYIIHATAGAGGTITPSDAVSVDEGADQTFAISADAGYQIWNVLVDGVSVGTGKTYTFVDVQKNHTIAASFRRIIHAITTTVGPGGTIDPSGAVSVTEGDDQTFTFTASKNYAIKDVLVDGASMGALSSYTFSNVTAHHTISATFEAIHYVITASKEGNGEIDPEGAISVNAGESLTFCMYPNSDYHVADVFVDSVSQGPVPSYTFTDVQANHTINALFAKNVFTITATAGGGGRIILSGEVSVYGGTAQTFTIIPNSGYQILDVLVDGVSVGIRESYTFEDVQADHVIQAHFFKAPPTVSTLGISNITHYSAQIGGEVTSEGGAEVTARGVCCSPTENPTVADKKTVDGTGTGFFISIITGLTPGTDYYVRAYATNSFGTGYGENLAFSTLPTLAPVPDIKANGSDVPIVVSSAESVSIDISLTPGVYAGANADWWIAVKTPFAPPGDWYTYVHPAGWLPGVNLCAQTGLFDLALYQVLNMTLPVGTYTFYFALDDPDYAATGPWWGLDSVKVTVE